MGQSNKEGGRVAMPKLADDIGSNIVKVKGGFEYSNTAIERLLETSYTLGTLVIDITGSLMGRERDLERIMREIVERLRGEDTARNILWRVVVFNDYVGVEEVHGFKLLQDIDPTNDYVISQCDGGTPLYDAVGSVIEATLVEAARLWDEEYGVNAISVFVTDGDENASETILKPTEIKEKTDKALRGEKIESYRTILVGVNPDDKNSSWGQHVSRKLSVFHAEAGLTEYVDMEDFSDKTIKKLILAVSSTTSDTSKQLGSGGPSQLTF